MSRGRSKKKTPARLPTLALSEFQLFPKLPAEIRRMIWSVVIPGQRAIRVVSHRSSKTTTPDDAPTYRLRYGPRYFMDHIPTVLLHICKESRTFALERYKPFLGSPCGDLPIYFDFEGDTLFFNSNLEWKFMTDISHEEREAEKKEVLRLAAVVDAMMNELAWHQSSGLDNWSVSNDGEAAPENDSSDDGTADDNRETDGTGYDGDRDSLFGDRGDGAFNSGIASDNEAEEREVYGDLDSLFGDGSVSDFLEDIEGNQSGDDDKCDLDSLFCDGAASDTAAETDQYDQMHLRGGAEEPLIGHDDPESAMEVDPQENPFDRGPLAPRSRFGLSTNQDTIINYFEFPRRGAGQSNRQGGEDDYGGDLDSLFGEGKYANRSGGVPYGRNDDGNWDDWDFLDGNSKTKVPEVKKWKEQLRFIALGGETCPNHESLAPFTEVLKVTVERGRAFGLTGLMKDHLLQGFKKGRRTENSAELPIIQFVNRIV